MNHLFDRNAIVYSESENAHVTAFTDYSEHCDQPYVFLGNECQDILTLVHELGHYTAFYHFKDAQLAYDTCEVHSQGNEWLIIQYLNGKLDQDVYEAFLLRRLRSGLRTMIVCTLVDEYEESIYTCGDISSPDIFENVMENVLDSYEGIEAIDTREYLYIYSQYVTIEAPVYYLSYATSELASMSLYAVAVEEGYETAQNIYMDLCLNTPTDKAFLDTLEDVGLPDPFEHDTFSQIIDGFEELFEENIENPAA